MVGTLLVDLDGTLLFNPKESFLPAYLRKVGEALSIFSPQEKVIDYLMASTQKMVDNLRPDRTLRQVFDECFFSDLGAEQKNVQPQIEFFYKDVFPTLRSLTHPIPGGSEFIDQAFKTGYRVVIATNSLFPSTAVQQRLSWADIPLNQYPYILLTSYESFHFSKPHPEFYAEILARLGWPEGPVAVIGDDLNHDIIPSQQLGLATFQTIYQPNDQLKSGSETPFPSGNFSDAWKWLQQSTPDSLTPVFDSLSSFLPILRSTPAALQTATEMIPQECWQMGLTLDEWSLTEIVCHLRDVEKEVNLPRVLSIVSQENPLITGIDTDQWADIRDYKKQDGSEVLADFIDTRLKLLSTLENLSPEDWHRTARHTIFGRTDLFEILRITISHELLHVRQFMNTLRNHMEEF